MITIQLDSVRKNRSADEYRMVNRATCGQYVSTGDGHNIKAVCLAMIADGYAPDSLVEVKRGDMLIFSLSTLSEWASVRATAGTQPAWLRRINSSAE